MSAPTLEECRAALTAADGALNEALAWLNTIRGKRVENSRVRVRAAYERVEEVLFGDNGFYSPAAVAPSEGGPEAPAQAGIGQAPGPSDE